MKPIKIATIKNGDAVMTVFYVPHAGEEYWERIKTEGDADMRNKFDLFMKVNILHICKNFPREWGKTLELAYMFADAYDYGITVHTME